MNTSDSTKTKIRINPNKLDEKVKGQESVKVAKKKSAKKSLKLLRGGKTLKRIPSE